MTMVAGTEIYDTDAPPVTARGVLYTDAELDDALSGSVFHILKDTSGKSDIEAMLAGVATTDFAQNNLKTTLEAAPPLHTWRVGEGLAEAYLTEHKDCTFPWPSTRDLRNPDVSPAGADFVGFQKTDAAENKHRFAFGEAKTSDEERYPPNTMYGRHGMVRQLENLRDSRKTKDALFLYLGHHANNAPWNPLYQSAASRYLNNPTDVSLFGVLVRDVEPKEEDLKSRASALADGCPSATTIHLVAMYFPKGCINTFTERATRAMEGDHANN